MKKKTYLICLLALSGVSVLAQSIVALHKATGVQHFSGTTAFRLAYNAAASGDTIYLPGGTFVLPDTIRKTVHVFGAGHYPAFTATTGETILTGELKLFAGAGNSRFEGVHFANAVTFLNNQAVNNVVFRRCRISGQIYYVGTSPYNTPSENTLFTECVLVFTGEQYFTNGRNITITNCISNSYTLTNMNYGIVANCIFLHGSTHILNSGTNSQVRNCVTRSSWPGNGGSNNSYYNNVFLGVSSPSYGGAITVVNNYLNVGAATFYVNQSGTTFDYNNNYRLQAPANFPGTDGTQVGIYGGLHPFKDGSVPMIPRIVSKNIALGIDPQARLQVNITVAAQPQ